MHGDGAHAHHHGAFTIDPEGLLDLGGSLVQFLAARAVRQLADQNHIPLADAEDKVILAVREHGLNGLRGNGFPLLQGPDGEDAPADIGGHPQFLGPHINIAQHDVVGDDVLDEGTPVMLFLIIALGRVQRYRCHRTDGLADLIIAKGENGVIKLVSPAAERLEGLAVKADHAAGSAVYRRHILAPALADHRQLAAGNDNALTVDHADGSIRVFLQLQNYVLKDSSGHGCSSSTRKLWITQGLPAHTYCAICQ